MPARDHVPGHIRCEPDPARPGRHRYFDVSCTNCDQPLDPASRHMVDEDGAWQYLQADSALWVTLTGGYGEFVDQIGDGPAHTVLCVDCARTLVDTFPGLAKVLVGNLSGHVGHHCDTRGGTLVWEPTGTCTADPDLHGWRTVFTVRDSDRVRYGAAWFDDRDAAERTAAACAAEHAEEGGEDLPTVREELLGNVRTHDRGEVRPAPAPAEG